MVKRPKSEVAAKWMAYCQENLAKYKTPRYIKVVSYVPKHLVGKVDKSSCVSRHKRKWKAFDLLSTD